VKAKKQDIPRVNMVRAFCGQKVITTGVTKISAFNKTLNTKIAVKNQFPAQSPEIKEFFFGTGPVSGFSPVIING
jgi:hypothetical protein